MIKSCDGEGAKHKLEEEALAGNMLRTEDLEKARLHSWRPWRGPPNGVFPSHPLKGNYNFTRKHKDFNCYNVNIREHAPRI